MGISFSIVATVDGYKMDNPYPGYGRLVANYRQEQEDFREAKEEETASIPHFIIKRHAHATGCWSARTQSESSSVAGLRP